MESTRLYLEPSRIEGPSVELAARLAGPDGRSCRLWWRLPREWAHAVTPWADPFVVGLILPMMQWRTDVVVEGRVSPSLLGNLETFMAIWSVWFPELYRPVAIRGAEEVEPPAREHPGQTIVPFSGGVDSCFTVWQHRQGLAGRGGRNLAAAAVMHGFDVSLGQPNASGIYDELLAGARAILDSVALPVVPMASNYRELPTEWTHGFTTQLVSGLSLLAGRFDSTLIPSNVGYDDLGRRWGGHPLSDTYLSSRAFMVRDDGAECLRGEKIAQIASWPQAMRHLRVCFGSLVDPSSPAVAANCCRCEKCVRTILTFKAKGLPVPPAFASDPSPRDIRQVRFVRRANIVQYWRNIVLAARAGGLGKSDWARAAAAAIRRNRRHWFWRRMKRPLIPLRNAFRRLLRGSTRAKDQPARRASAP